MIGRGIARDASLRDPALLTTKLFVPRGGAALVPRPRLIARLDEGLRLERRLTLVVAPPGWGKTTLLSAWLGGLAGRAVAWVSLDAGDNDPISFWSYVLLALGPSLPAETAPLLALLRSPQPPPVESMLAELLNALTVQDVPVVLVLDDYHVIDAQSIHAALTFLIDHLPSHLHLVLASRADPPLPVGRLRARGTLTELRAADLSFIHDEATAFLNQTMDQPLAPAQVTALEQRTEGWIAGLQLAALAMRAHPDTGGFIAGFSGSHRFVVDYLAEEVFERQAPDVRDFLLRTAVLARLSAPLCAALLEDAGAPGGGAAAAQAMLERLERANLFLIPLDDERRWYRYHHLFADVLRARLAQTDPEWVPDLYRRAAAWCAARAGVGGLALLTEAIGYAVAGDDPPYAADLIEANAGAALWRDGDAAAVRRWLAQLPLSVISSRVLLCLISSQLAYIGGDVGGVATYLGQAQDALAAMASPPPELRAGVTATEGWVALLRGEFARGRVLLEQALAVLAGPSLERSLVLHALGEFYLRGGRHAAAAPHFTEVVEVSRAGGFTTLAISGMSGLVRCRIFDGLLVEAAAICREGLGLAARQGARWGLTVANLHWMLGMILYEWNQLAEAEDHVRTAQEISRLGSYRWLQMAAALTLAQVLLARGERAEATAALGECAQVAGELGYPHAAMQAAALRLLNDLEPAVGLGPAAFLAAVDEELTSGSDPVFAVEAQYYAPLRVLLQEGATQADAQDRLGRLLVAEEAAGRRSRVIALLALQAEGQAARGANTLARRTLEWALGLAAPGGFVRTFLVTGPRLAGLLAAAPAGTGPGAEYARRLSTHLAHPAGARPSRPPAEGLVEPLTERELEVLRLVAAGASNREIAAQLIVSLGTVKKHTNNIFGKLGVQSRTRAVVKARALGLVD